MILAALLMMIPPPPPPFGPIRGMIDCLLDKGGNRYAAMIEINQEDTNSQVVLRQLGLDQGVNVNVVELVSGAITGRNGKGEIQFQLTPTSSGKWGEWWRYAAGGTSGVCYGNLYGAQTSQGVFTTVASVEVN